jgi:hypothetical protein
MVREALKEMTSIGDERSGADGLYDLAAVVVAACGTDVVRPLQLTTIRAFAIGRRRKRIMRAPHITAGLGYLFLRDCHNFLLSYKSPPPRLAYVAKFDACGKPVTVIQDSGRTFASVANGPESGVSSPLAVHRRSISAPGDRG